MKALSALLAELWGNTADVLDDGDQGATLTAEECHIIAAGLRVAQLHVEGAALAFDSWAEAVRECNRAREDGRAAGEAAALIGTAYDAQRAELVELRAALAAVEETNTRLQAELTEARERNTLSAIGIERDELKRVAAQRAEEIASHEQENTLLREELRELAIALNFAAMYLASHNGWPHIAKHARERAAMAKATLGCTEPLPFETEAAKYAAELEARSDKPVLRQPGEGAQK